MKKFELPEVEISQLSTEEITNGNLESGTEVPSV